MFLFFLLKNPNFCYLWKHFKIKNENPAGWICFVGIEEQNSVSKWNINEEWNGIVLYFLSMFWINGIRGGGWLCLGEREIELCHARRKFYQGTVLQTHSSSPGLVYGFVICVAILDFLSPSGWKGQSQGSAGMLLLSHTLSGGPSRDSDSTGIWVILSALFPLACTQPGP